MITSVRHVVPVATREPDRAMILARNQGVISTVLARVEEAIRESLQRGGYERIVVDLNTDPTGLKKFDILTGKSLNTK
jgi:hypothetical protein